MNKARIFPSSASPSEPNGHNVAVSKVDNVFYVNDDRKSVYTTTEEYVGKFVTVLVYQNQI